MPRTWKASSTILFSLPPAMQSPTLLSTPRGRNIFSSWKMNETTGADTRQFTFTGFHPKFFSAATRGFHRGTWVVDSPLFLCVPQPALSDSELAKEESYGCPLWFRFVHASAITTLLEPSRHIFRP